MNLENIAKRKPLGKLLLASCLILVLAALLTTAAEEKYVCSAADLNQYGTMKFCLPSDVVVEPESISELDYAGGKAVTASLLLDGNRVGLHLIYPCAGIQTKMSRTELKGFLNTYDSALAETKYNDSYPEPDVWGMIGNQLVVGHQKNNQTVILVLMDMNISEPTKVDFLDNLSITLNESATPITPGYCTDTTAVASGNDVTEQSVAAEATTAADNAAEGTEEKTAATSEKKTTGIEAAQDRLNKLMNAR